MYKTVRLRFLSACKRVAREVGVTEMLVLPEGTVLEDSVKMGAAFGEIQLQAVQKLGGDPNLDAARFFSKNEILRIPQNRVHYFSFPLNVRGKKS